MPKSLSPTGQEIEEGGHWIHTPPSTFATILLQRNLLRELPSVIRIATPEFTLIELKETSV